MNKSIEDRNKGFTLVELLIVVVIIVVLTGIFTAVYINHVESCRIAKDRHLVNETIRAINVIINDTQCYDELAADFDSDGNTYYDVDIAIALSDHPNYLNKGYTVWHLYDESNNVICPRDSKILKRLDEVIDGEKIHFCANAHKNKAYMIKIYRNEQGKIVVSPYTDDDYTYKPNGSVNDEYYKGGWSSEYYSKPAPNQ